MLYLYIFKVGFHLPLEPFLCALLRTHTQPAEVEQLGDPADLLFGVQGEEVATINCGGEGVVFFETG